jgi:uncharacterized protein
MSRPAYAAGAGNRFSDSPDSGERLVVLDALRGFALFGVVVANVLVSSGFKPYANPSLIAHGRDRVTFDWFILEFITGKFMAQFAILFGFGFGLMLQRAAARGTAFVPRYLRRTAALFLFGALSQILFGGDVLANYAMMALVLVACRDASNRTLILICIASLFMRGITQVPREFLQHHLPSGRDLYNTELRLHQSGAALELLAHRARHLWTKALPSLVLGNHLACFGIGFLAARAKLLHEVEHRTGFFVRVLVVAIMVAAIFRGLGGRLDATMGVWSPPVATFAQAIAYMSAFVVLWNQGGRIRSALAALAPVGRTALTCYLSVGVIGIMLFDLTGTYYRVGALAGAAIGVVVYGAMLATAHWWFGHFRLGPIEWVWRSITYGRLQALRVVESMIRGGTGIRPTASA